LAQLSGVPFGTLKNIMRKKGRGAEQRTVIMLASGLGITPSEFTNDPSFCAVNLDLD